MGEFQEYPVSTDNVHIYLYGPDGELKQHESTHNLVVTAGKNWLATFLAGTNTSAQNIMAIGTSTAVAAADTTLGNEVSNPRVVGTQFASSNIYQLTATFGANNPGTGTSTYPLMEVGIFNHPSNNSGSMYVHAGFAVVNKASADTLQIVWQITNS